MLLPAASHGGRAWKIIPMNTTLSHGRGIKWTDCLWALGATAPPFLAYLSTVAPTVWWLDSAELTTGAFTLGIVHAPGAPLYLLLGHLFAKLPFGDVGYRLNLMSVCTSSLSVLFVYLIIQHLTRQRLLALATAWFTAFGFYVWLAAVAAELYSLQGCFVVGLLFLALKWREQQRPWQLCLLALLFGLGTGNHISLVLLLPGFALLALATPLPWQRPRWLAAAIACGLLGGLVWLYLPLRYAADPALNYARIWGVKLDTWSGFWWMITGQMFEPLFFSVPLSAMPDKLLGYLYELWSNFLGIGAIFAVWGLLSDLQRRPLFNCALLLMFIGYLIFYLPYNAVDQATMLLPSYLIWAIWGGLGVYHLDQRFAWGRFAPSWPAWSVLLLALAVGMFGFNYRRADLHDNWSARERGEQIFSALGANAVFFGTWIDEPILEYLQIVESQRPDVHLVNVLFTTPEQTLRMIATAVASDKPVYTTVREFLGAFGVKTSDYEDCNCFRVSYTKTTSMDPNSAETIR